MVQIKMNLFRKEFFFTGGGGDVRRKKSLSPCVVLLKISNLASVDQFNNLIKDLCLGGAVHFATLGGNSERLEDLVDDEVEAIGFLDVITTSHGEEDVECVLDFILSVAQGKYEYFKVVLIFDHAGEWAERWEAAISERRAS